ncbi:MAG: RNA-guided endonuclease InsQ/TnpB family protein [Blastocatellia bacterium]
MIKAHKIRLNPTIEQKIYFYRAAGVARFAWNWALEEYQRRKAAGEEIDWNEIKKAFRAKIDAEFSFVREVTKCAAEQAINDLHQAINTYYKTKKNNPKSKVKFPGRRKRSRKVGSFGLNNDKFSTTDTTVRVPKLGDVNMAEAVRFNGKVLSGRIKEQAGNWYLIITIEVEPLVQPAASPRRSVGIDFGLSTFATLSNGEKSETQAPYRKAERKLKRLQRGLARKKKGSNNRKKWKLKVARAHARIANLRSDFLHKFTTKVVNAFSIICVEDLSLRGWIALAGKSTHDAGVGKAIDQLEYKTRERGGMMQKIGRFFPSSKRCHCCGSVNQDLKLSDRSWKCPQCGVEHDRDRNASINQEMEGVRLLVGSGFLDATTVEFAASATNLGSFVSRGL